MLDAGVQYALHIYPKVNSLTHSEPDHQGYGLSTRGSVAVFLLMRATKGRYSALVCLLIES